MIRRWLRLAFRPHRRRYLVELEVCGDTLRRVRSAPFVTLDHIRDGLWYLRAAAEDRANRQRLAAWRACKLFLVPRGHRMRLWGVLNTGGFGPCA